MKIPGWIVYGSAFGTFLGGGALMREKVFGEPLPDETVLRRAKGKIAVVTGANSGIGKEIATVLAANGARVVMACRDMPKCEKVRKEIVSETENRHVVCRKCDLGSYSSIREFVSRIKEEEPKIDILVNNAGVMGCKKSVTSEGLETHFAVNYLGHFLLDSLMIDKLLANPEPARIVTVCDSAARQAKLNFADLNNFENYDAKEAYNQSKLALVLFTLLLKEKLKGSNVSVVNAEAGGLVNTPLLRHMGIYKSFLAAIFVWPLAYPFLRTAKHGAATPVFAVLCPSESLPSPSSSTEDLVPYLKDKTKVVDEWLNKLSLKDAERLWAISEHWTGTKFPLPLS